MKPEIDKATPPDKVYLQYYGDGDPEIEEPADIDDNDATWCRDKIFTHDVPYVRQSTADERVREARREVWDAAIRLGFKVHAVKLAAARDAVIDNEYASIRLGHEADGALRIVECLEAARAAEGEG